MIRQFIVQRASRLIFSNRDMTTTTTSPSAALTKKTFGRNKGKSNNSSGPSIKVFTSDFWGKFRKSCRGIARFKVHSPSCTCSKVVNFRKRLHEQSERNLTEFDGSLVVIPDIKVPLTCFAFSLKSEGNKYEGKVTSDRDVIRWHENCLKSEIYEKTMSDENKDLAIEATKISCAQCLLKHNEANGFACITSPSYDTIATIRDSAIASQNEKRMKNKGLHADHAHYVCAISFKILISVMKARTRSEVLEAYKRLAEELQREGLPEQRLIEVDKYKIGHHLMSVLASTSKSLIFQQDYCFLMIFDDSKCFTLDFPGGKRHLGEKAYDCAIRETEEETSLYICHSWLDSKLTNDEYKEGDVDKFFLFRPPPQLESAVDDDNITKKFTYLSIENNISRS